MATEIKQLDVVRLITTKHVRYLSAPSGVPLDPHGPWSVVGNIGRDLLVCKGGILCKIPVVDVEFISKSPTSKILEIIDGKAETGKDAPPTK